MPEANVEQALNQILGFGPKYPTKEEIMAEPWPTHKTGLVRNIITWKREVWKNSKYDSSLKAIALHQLVQIMARAYENPCNFTIQENIPSPCYNPATKTIHMNESMSIISTMHEFAHHQFGPDEKKACRWSVHLFRKTFPKAYGQLVWQGHCLVKP